MLKISVTTSLAVACGLALAGCSGSSGERSFQRDRNIAPGLTTGASLIVLNPDGSLPDTGIDEDNSRTVTGLTVNGGGFVYQIGRSDDDTEFLGVAGLRPDTQVGGAPTMDSASYSGRYSLGYADRTEFEPEVKGQITLSADFNTGLLTGQSGGLAIEGTIDGQTIGGKATYRGVDATLIGRIGSERAVGAFAGHTDDAVLTGGIIADAQ